MAKENINNFVIGFPDPEERIDMQIMFPHKDGLSILSCQTSPKYIIECMVIFDPVYFKDKYPEFLYNRKDTYFIHKN